MKKTVTIGDHEIDMETSGAIPRMYRRTFGSDLLIQTDKFRKRAKGKEVQMEPEDIEMFENMAWIFAYHADPDIPEIDKWLQQFEPADILLAAPQIIDLWNAETKTTSKLKKKAEKPTGK